MSPASYLTAPPRGGQRMLAPSASKGRRCGPACGSLKSRNDVGRVSGGSAWDAVLGPLLRPSDPLADAGRVDGVPASPAPLARVAVLLAVRNRPGAGLLLHRRGSAARGHQVAQPRLDVVRPHTPLARGAVQHHLLLRPSHPGRRRGRGRRARRGPPRPALVARLRARPARLRAPRPTATGAPAADPHRREVAGAGAAMRAPPTGWGLG